jgi:hypothetical protein
MKTGRILAGIVGLGVLLSAFPASARAQACCLLPQAAAQQVEETEKKPLPQTAAPTRGEGGMMRGMLAWCMDMMRHCMPSLATAQPAAPQQETPRE